MAKVASSKPYGSGKRNNSASEPETVSPLRTSPRRRKSGIEQEGEAAVSVSAVQESRKLKQKIGKKSKAPSPPRFNDNKKQRKETKSSPKTRGRRKSGLEPVIFSEEPSAVAENEEEEEDEVIDYVETINQQGNEVAEEDFDSEDNVYTEEQDDSEDIVYTEEQDDSEDNVYTEEQYTEYTEEQYTDHTESEEFHYDEDDNNNLHNNNSETGLNESIYNDQFKYTSESVRSRLSHYFNRHDITNNASTTGSQLWNKMKEWISERVLPGAREIGEYTRRAVERISRGIESKRDDNEEAGNVEEHYVEEANEYVNENEYVDNYSGVNNNDYIGDAEYVADYEYGQLAGSDTSSPNIYEITEERYQEHSDPTDYHMDEDASGESKESSYHSLMHDDTIIMEPTTMKTPEKSQPQPQFVQSSSSMMNSDVLDSRLTEIILFLAKCNKNTSLHLIYEHLEELFTLKGDKSLNFTEKQLVSTVLRDLLTEKAADSVDTAANITVDGPVYEAIVLKNERSSPKKIKVLPSSGIRFRAPKFTAEEETRLEEMEQARLRQQQQSMSKLTASLATPSQRSKMQRKLLDPESTAEMIENMRENRGSIGVVEKWKDDGITSAIEDIISQKIKEAKRKDEFDRLETEKLKQRVSELERESRERSTKESLLQKQLEEQKKELESEREASRSKIESLKAKVAVAAVKPEVQVPTIPSFGARTTAAEVPAFMRMKPQEGAPSTLADEKPPSTPAFNFGNFGSFEQPKKEAAAVASESAKPNFTPFSSFDFGAAVKTEEVKKNLELNPEAAPFQAPTGTFGFSFGAAAKNESSGDMKKDANDEKEMEPKKPASSFGFGGFKPTSTTRSFGASDPPFKSPFGSTEQPSTSETKSPFDTFKPAGETVKPALDTFKIADTSTSTSASAAFKIPTSSFNFESKPASSSGFNFGTVDNKSSFGFGSSSTIPNTSAANPFSFGASSAIGNPAPSSQTSSGTGTNAANPFAALSSNTNLFTSSAPTAFNSFSFGTTNNSTADFGGFGFPPINSSGNGAVPIIPMNFGGANPNEAQQNPQMDMSFQAGRSISIPKRRRK